MSLQAILAYSGFVIIVLHRLMPLLAPLGFPSLSAFGFGVFSIAPLLWLAALFARKRPNPTGAVRFTKDKLYPRVVVFFICLVLLTILGWANGNLPINIAYDAWAFFVCLLFCVLGADDDLLRQLEKPLTVLYWIAAGAVVLGLSRSRLTLEAQGIGLSSFDERVGTATMGYDISNLLDLWPMLFLLGTIAEKRDRWRLFQLLTCPTYLAFQIYFQKRAPCVRAVAYVAFAIFFLHYVATRPAFRKYSSTITQLRSAARYGSVVALLVAVALAWRLDVDALVARFQQRDVSRLVEAKVMLTQLSTKEVFCGRGMGGYFLWGRSRADAGAVVVTQRGQLGKTVVHIGLLVPILKGGVAFFLVLTMFVAPWFKRVRNDLWLMNRYNIIAAIILPVYILFRGIEGFFSTAVVFDAVLVGFCLSRIWLEPIGPQGQVGRRS